VTHHADRSSDPYSRLAGTPSGGAIALEALPFILACDDLAATQSPAACFSRLRLMNSVQLDHKGTALSSTVVMSEEGIEARRILWRLARSAEGCASAGE
jgi:hypothetical protein